MINIDTIDSRIIEASKDLNAAGVYDFLRQGSNIPARLTRTQLNVVSALELTLACYAQVFDYVEKTLDTVTYNVDSEKFRESRVFANRYALFIGSEVGLHYLHDGERQQPQEEIETKTLNFKEGRQEVIKNISEHLVRFLQEATSADQGENRIIEATDLYLHSLKNASLHGANHYEHLFLSHPELEYASVFSVEFKRFHVQGKSEKEKVFTFEDYAGQEDAVKELKKVAKFVKNQQPFRMWGAKSAKGLLLAGPPGTGKTYLARVFADVCGLPFHAVKISDIVNELYGKSSRLTKELLQRPGVIFIDEFESVGRKVGDRNTHEATEQIVNTMKDVMDGIDSKATSYDQPITFYIAATNNLEIIEPALRRPGRLKPLIMQPYGEAGLAKIYEIRERQIVKSSTGERVIFDKDIDAQDIGKLCSERELVPADIEYIMQSIVNDKGFEQEKVGVDVVLPPITQDEIITAIHAYERSDDLVIKSVLAKR